MRGVSIASLLLSALVANFGLLAAAGIEPRESCPISDSPDYSVLLPDPTDCTKFYLCSNGIPILMSCPSGLNFNNDLKVCDYPQNAGCVKQCLALEDDDGGHWTPSSCSSGPNDVGEICSLQCSQDYELKGSAQVECTKDGWNSSNGFFIPKCLPSECIGEDLENDLNETLSVNASLLFVLDESGSVTEPDFNKTKEFVKNIVSKFPLSANRSAGVITFSSSSLVRIHLTENSTSSFLSKVDGIKYRSGGTNILDGLQTALAEIKTYRVHNLTLVFLITDGISETDGTPAADEIKKDNNPLFAIGVGQTKLVHLESLSSAGANGIKHFFHIRSYDVLDSIGKYINGTDGSGGSSNSTQCKNP